MWTSIVKWWRSLWYDEFILTVYFPDKIETKPDGTTVQGFEPKIYTATKITKLTTTHIKFVDENKCQVEIKVTNPVGYDLKKLY
tara:strand:+ start:2495 stop:2746 length:252 start_codon:yes stop_codon:yes gene_type:complete